MTFQDCSLQSTVVCLSTELFICDMFKGSGVSTDLQTSYAARIMAISIVPFIIVQLPRIFNFPSGQSLAVLLSLIVAIVLLVSYCLYQVTFDTNVIRY